MCVARHLWADLATRTLAMPSNAEQSPEIRCKPCRLVVNPGRTVWRFRMELRSMNRDVFSDNEIQVLQTITAVKLIWLVL